MDRNYRMLWWRHCLAIIGFSVIPLFDKRRQDLDIKFFQLDL
jgi:hypothetical protein